MHSRVHATVQQAGEVVQTQGSTSCVSLPCSSGVDCGAQPGEQAPQSMAQLPQCSAGFEHTPSPQTCGLTGT